MFPRTRLASRLSRYHNQSLSKSEPVASGRLIRVIGLTLEAVGIRAQLGQQCKIFLDCDHTVTAEVVGFSDQKIYLMPIKNIEGLKPGAKVLPLDENNGIAIGADIIGRVIDGLGDPLDGKQTWLAENRLSLTPHTINPMKRALIKDTMDVGIRAINALLTVGRGQRIGLFAGSGVGKSVLLGMITKYTNADIVIVGLIGERGREVKEFIEQNLGEEGRKKAVVVASPADDPPLMRLRASQLTTRLAEHYRDQKKHVLLLMDSLTRYAQAQREIGLATGEPPTTKGYPPSVFSKLPQLVERAGNSETGEGSITAIYTVLTEGDDLQDPIADSARAILDGHIVLSRQLAEEGVYPAIDIEASISRLMTHLVDKEQQSKANKFKQLLSVYRQNKDLISMGAYSAGADGLIDEAVAARKQLIDFIRQDIDVAVDYSTAESELKKLPFKHV